jgi:hypothetical protein
VLASPLTDLMDHPMESGSLCPTPIVHQAPFLHHFCKLSLHTLELGKVLLLNLSILHLNYREIFFVFFGKLAESLGELARLLAEETLRILGFMSCSINQLIKLAL